MIARKLMYVILMVISLTTQAETRIALGGWSYHLQGEGITNSVHNVLGVEYEGYSAGYFKNSYGRDTFFMGKNWSWHLQGHFNLTASLGINRGYRKCYSDDGDSATICPHGYIGFEYDKFWIVPSIKLQPGMYLFSPEIRF